MQIKLYDQTVHVMSRMPVKGVTSAALDVKKTHGKMAPNHPMHLRFQPQMHQHSAKARLLHR